MDDINSNSTFKKNLKCIVYSIAFVLVTLLLNCITSISSYAGSFSIVFFDVDQGDSALIECDGHHMLIDGGKPYYSQKLYSYLKSNNISSLDYIVATHADTDHVGGLAGALNYATADIALSPVTSSDSEAFNNFKKYLGQTTLTVPSAGDSFSLGSSTFQVVGPVEENASDNNTSLVIRIAYGDTSFIFMGDAETSEEMSILEAGYPVNSTLIKVAHHGSNSSSSEAFLDAVNPSHAIISVGSDNSYGHPTSETLEKLKSRVSTLHRTDVHGDIFVTSDGSNISISPSKNSSVDPYVYLPYVENLDTFTEDNNVYAESAPIETVDSSSSSDGITSYILNTNTRKFHYPYCKSVSQMKEKNKQEFTGSRSDVM